MSNFRMFVSLLFNFLVLVQNNANIVSLYFFIQVNGKQGCAYNFDTQHVVWPWINEKYFFLWQRQIPIIGKCEATKE